MTKAKQNETRKILQQLMHYHGCEEFLQLTREAMDNAADDTMVDLSDKTIAARYSTRAMQLITMIEDEPSIKDLEQIAKEF